ncbi:MAG: glycosyltransferase [Myxococcales bacterium]|nr:glycosyltransferase [Myxococcales bacterium]
MQPRPLSVLSFLDAPVVTGPARGLIHLGRALPPSVRLHVAILRGRGAGPVPPLDTLSGGALTVHTLDELGPFDPTLFVRAARLARELKARVLQSHSYKPHLLALATSKVLQIPWVGHHHGWTAENPKVKRYHQLDAWSLPKARRVVAVAQSAADIVAREGVTPGNIVVIANAVDARDLQSSLDREAARAALGLSPEAYVGVVIGRLSHEKGQDVALDALAEARQQGAAVTLAFAGDGPDREALEALARARGLTDAVHFLGHQREVGRVYAAADLLVLPSRSEAMPNVLLEAMTLGVPVVSTRVGGVPEVARDGVDALIVPSEDPSALAAAIVATVRDPEARARRVAEAKAVTHARHDPARRAERYLDLYETLLKQPIARDR